jgi:hypothetical protein
LEDRPFLLALQRAVVPLVEPPVPAGRDPDPAGGLQREIPGAYRAREQGGVHHGRQQPGLAQQSPALPCLLLTERRQVDIDPPCEQVLGVPLALAVPKEDQSHRAFRILSRRVIR